MADIAAKCRSFFKVMFAIFETLVFPLIELPEVCSKGATPA